VKGPSNDLEDQQASFTRISFNTCAVCCEEAADARSFCLLSCLPFPESLAEIVQHAHEDSKDGQDPSVYISSSVVHLIDVKERAREAWEAQNSGFYRISTKSGLKQRQSRQLKLLHSLHI